MKKLLLSVIIPVYNVEKYLRECLDSVISQSFKNIEIICIDDCSTDTSLDVLREYARNDKRITIIRNKQNLGVGLTRNIGLKVSSGNYVHFLDPDDWLLNKSVYANILQYIEKTDIDILFTNYREFNNVSGEYIPHLLKNNNVLNKILNPTKDIEAFDNWDRMCWLKIFKRDFLLANNIFFSNYTSLSDVEWSALVYTNCKSICYVNEEVVVYRSLRENSLSCRDYYYKNIKDIFKMFIADRKIYKKLPYDIRLKLLGFDYYIVRNGINEAYKRKFINFFDLVWIIFSMNQGDYKKYEYKDYPYKLQLSLWKVLMQTHAPFCFSLIVKLKRKLFKNT